MVLAECAPRFLGLRCSMFLYILLLVSHKEVMLRNVAVANNCCSLWSELQQM